LDHSLGSALQRCIKESLILAVRYQDYVCPLSLRNQLLQGSEFIVQNLCVHQQHIGRVTTNGFCQATWILAFGKNADITFIRDGTPHSDKREGLVVHKNNVDLSHMIHSIPASWSFAIEVQLLDQNEFQGHEKLFKASFSLWPDAVIRGILAR